MPRDRTSLSVGRNEQCDVALSWDAKVSWDHAQLHGEGEWTLYDHHSTNGSFVNGDRIAGQRRLRDSDRLRFGDTEVVYHDPRPSMAGYTENQRADRWLSATHRRVLIALCRPLVENREFASPATNRQIAAEVHLSVDAVKGHLGTLFERFKLRELPQNEKRQRLARTVLHEGLVTKHDF